MKYQFDQRFHTTIGDKLFSFSTLYNSPGTEYRISTLDENHRLYSFSMKQNEDGDWKIVSPQPPAYIMDLESELSKAIQES